MTTEPQTDQISKHAQSHVYLEFAVEVGSAEAIASAGASVNTVNDPGSSEPSDYHRTQPLGTILKALSTGGLSLLTKQDE